MYSQPSETISCESLGSVRVYFGLLFESPTIATQHKNVIYYWFQRISMYSQPIESSKLWIFSIVSYLILDGYFKVKLSQPDIKVHLSRLLLVLEIAMCSQPLGNHKLGIFLSFQALAAITLSSSNLDNPS